MIVDKQGLDQIDELLIVEKNKLREAVKQKAIAFQNDTNSWHDNAAYDAALERENESIEEINRLIDIKMTVEVISKHNLPNQIDIGDTVTVGMDDDDIFDVKLTGKFLANSKDGEVTLNSPIGAAIFKKQINDTVSYNAHGQNKCTIKILAITKP